MSFQVFHKTGAVEREIMIKEVAKVGVRAELKERMDSETFKATDAWQKKRLNSQDAMKNAQQFKRDYEKSCPETLSPEVESRMWLRAKQLKDEFIHGMLSRSELHPVRQFSKDGAIQAVVDTEQMNMDQTVAREGAWLKQNQDKVREFKNLMRHLDPNNPNAGDIEKYRPRGAK